MNSPAVREALASICAIAAGLSAVVGALSLDIFAVRSDRPVAILFPARMAPDDAFRSIIAAGGLPVREAKLRLWGGVVWIAAAGDKEFFEQVKGHGALAVINPLAVGGCLLAGSQ